MNDDNMPGNAGANQTPEQYPEELTQVLNVQDTQSAAPNSTAPEEQTSSSSASAQEQPTQTIEPISQPSPELNDNQQTQQFEAPQADLSQPYQQPSASQQPFNPRPYVAPVGFEDVEPQEPANNPLSPVSTPAPLTQETPASSTAPAAQPYAPANAQSQYQSQPQYQAQAQPQFQPQGQQPMPGQAPNMAAAPTPLMVAQVQPTVAEQFKASWRTKKGRAAWILSIIAAVVVIAVAIIAPNMQAIAVSLGMAPKNPFAVTAESMRNIPKAKSAKVGISAHGMQGDETLNIKGYYSLGSSVDKSVADFTVKTSDSNLRLVWNNGGFYGNGNGDYTYLDAADVHSSIKDIEFNCLPAQADSSTCYDGASLYEFEQAIIKGGHWNFAEAGKLLQNSSKKLKKQYADELTHSDSSKDSDTKNKYSKSETEAVSKQSQASMNKFFTKTLDQKDVKEAVFPDITTEKVDGGTRLEYSVDFEQLIRAFSQYMLDNRKAYPDLSDYLNDMFSSFGQSYREVFKEGASFRMPSEMIARRLQMTLDMDSNNNMKSLTFKIKGLVSLNVSIDELNSVKVDTADLDEFVSKAKEGESLKDSSKPSLKNKLPDSLGGDSSDDWGGLGKYGDSDYDWDDWDDDEDSDDGFSFSNDGVEVQPSGAFLRAVKELAFLS
ncbi:hypothetical protein KIMH_00870 [Bombiscardovia apis]|uniref:Uncharacterized protein n=1 Tax=Bombiscardovia apis TaxID=2932182 RepID=A0ABN6SGF2_9BIFI|nr:hypothetical protein [Bombiscardovia apis]BDR53976.1 hypothetical protein KIMH_00870 [Bombiscardovia apis]